MTPNEAERAAFEKWAESEGYDVRPMCDIREDLGDEYVSQSTRNAWGAWCASVSPQYGRALSPTARAEPLTDEQLAEKLYYAYWPDSLRPPWDDLTLASRCRWIVVARAALGEKAPLPSLGEPNAQG